MPRCGGIATMMRLPNVGSAEGLDACFVGVPFDLGTSNRTGARFGPRQIRSESVLLRPYNMATRAAPFDSLRVADIGDVAINPYNLLDSIARIETAYDEILQHGTQADHARRRSHDRAADPARDSPQVRQGWPDSRRCARGRQRHHDGREDRARHAVPPRGGRGLAGLRACRADRPARHGLRSRRLRLVPRPGLRRGAGRGVLEPVARAADGARARTHGRWPGVHHVRYRRHRSGVRAGHRHAGNRRADRAAGARDYSRLTRPEYCRLRSG